MKKVIFIAVILASILIISNLARSIYDLWNKKDLISQYQKQLEKEKERNGELKRQLSQVNDNKFVEQEARDNLFLVKPGEQKVIIPGELLVASPSAKPIKETPNWQKWLSLFL